LDGALEKCVFPAPSITVITQANADQRRDDSSVAADSRLRFSRTGYTLVEVMVALGVLAICAVAITQALLQINRQAAISRVTNAAKAEALSRIQQVSQCSYDPDASPPVIPSILTVGTSTTSVDLGSNLTGLGSIPATETWTVASVSGDAEILSVKCAITYQYLKRNLSYELFTYKSPD
jgi:prepilin-type N-terminal cleavage/methylation domain-containing protein